MAAGVYCIIASSKSKCYGETTFSKIVSVQNFAGIGLGFLGFGASVIMFGVYQTSGYVPLFGESKKKTRVVSDPIDMKDKSNHEINESKNVLLNNETEPSHLMAPGTQEEKQLEK